MVEFVHLHNHTEYSFLDGVCKLTENGKPAELFKLAQLYKMPAIAITDHGNMCGAIEFYQACVDSGIKPIIGCEVYLAPESRFDKKVVKGQETTYHLTLLAKDYIGYKNLLKLTSIAYLEGFYHKPRVDKELLRKYNQGIICLSGCIHGEVPYLILNDKLDEAKKAIDEYKSIYGDDFYIELMDNNMAEQKKLIPILVDLAKDASIKIVATNDTHYLRKEDALIHDVFLCIGTATKLSDTKRLKFPTDEFYFKSPQQMYELFKDIPNSITNTLEIAEKCDIKMPSEVISLPKLKTEIPPEELLEKLCYEGLKRKFENVTDEIINRLKHELKIIKNMALASYFLIVHDIIKYAKEHNISVGPGRGSGAGSLVSYLLDITDISPIKYGLLFERFLNPARKALPDLDIDFSDTGRDKVIEYIRERYGQNSVAQIITFQTILAKMAVRDVGRVLDKPQFERDKIAKLIPFGLTIYQAINAIPELKNMYETSAEIKRWLDIAMRIEGIKRQIGTHAAGIVITDGELTEHVPLMLSKEKAVITGYADDVLLKLGLLKIDILGLRTLSIIDECQDIIRKYYDANFDVTKISLDDKRTFKIYQEAKTIGVFHGESTGMRDLLRRLKPNCFEDIIAALALFRPGPIRSGMLNEFIERKHQRRKIEYAIETLADVLSETYGVMLYQEQVMEIAKRVASFSEEDADLLRQAMSKKIPEEIEMQEAKFIAGAIKNGIQRRVAKKIFKDISHFGEYGFNKSHAAAYALISYRTAYLKAHYPLPFFIALLNSEAKLKRAQGGAEEKKISIYIKDAEEFGIKVLPPDVNKSEQYFSIENGNIRFGLAAIKNVGENAAQSIIETRKKYGEFKTLTELSLLTSRKITKKTIEALIKAGACDSLKKDYQSVGMIRAALMHELESKSKTLQRPLFDDLEKPVTIQPWPEHTVLSYEKEMIGFYFSGHPLIKHFKKIKLCSTHTISEILEDGMDVSVGGIVVSIKKIISKNGAKNLARFKLEDTTGEISVFVPPEIYEKYYKNIENQSIVIVRGKSRIDEERKEIVADEILKLNTALSAKFQDVKQVYLRLNKIAVDEKLLDDLGKILNESPGGTKVYIKLFDHDNLKTVIETEHSVFISTDFIRKIEKTLGEDSLEFL